MNTRHVDAVHFFDSRGVSTMSFDFLLREKVRLEKEVERLTRLLDANQRRQRAELDERTKQNS
jgi:hypothetical protein